MAEARPYDPGPALELFARAGVDFVVIGGVAGGAHGSAYGTIDLDLAYSRDPENLERIVTVLRSIEAKLKGAPPDAPYQLDAESLRRGANFTFATTLGAIDLLGDPAGAPPFERLRAEAIVIELRGLSIRVASLDHLIAMKEAAGRPRDRLMAMEYRMLSDRLRAP
jgi:hypothetical protein